MTDPAAHGGDLVTGDGTAPAVEHASMDAAPELFAGGRGTTAESDGDRPAPAGGDE